ncbi:Rqc2 family fibronectin-binding protein [Halalkalibacter urbisdiaboli]|uniref:Rqc2 family fibronectin-binding protein n=1 Tax=Halalkalibacter urbisdiaboli TaxID=1960589 RepID=UPI000B4510FF|nr:NFACT RNA binding domain-containing protein [Halalkalibacter urbisdiaboli]
MSFDGIMTRAITKELTDALTTGRISKIYQPYKTELILTIRANGKNHQLLLSANANFARAHLTNEKYENPAEPPMFCMLLRKHLEGSIIENIKQIGMERIITIDVKNKDELGDVTYKQLIVEIMGRHSNIILIDRKSNLILDSIKHIGLAQSSYRTVLPGQTYKLPPEQEKVNPLDVNAEELLKRIDFNSGKIDRQLLEKFAGLSPLIAKEITTRAGMINRQSLPKAFEDVIEPIRQHRYKPEIVFAGKEYFSVVTLTQVEGERKTFSTTSDMLDRFYYGKAERDRVKQQAFDLERFLRNELQKNKKKIKKLEQTLSQAEQAKTFQKLGELLTANLHAVKRGDKSIEVIDYYDEEGKMIDIPLDPLKSPSDNAQSYFKKYNKAKNSVAIVEEQIEKANAEIDYFEQLTQQMESASPKDVEEIREELIEEGYIRRRQKQKKKRKDEKPQFEKYVSSTGLEFFVGKNNKQNEYLTNRFARQDEIWLHTKDIPGSHVVIRSTDPDEVTLKEAATIAAYFSKAKQSSSVPVDFTKIRHVKKPNGAKPGFVIYDNQTTLYVTPSEDLALTLRSR